MLRDTLKVNWVPMSANNQRCKGQIDYRCGHTLLCSMPISRDVERDGSVSRKHLILVRKETGGFGRPEWVVAHYREGQEEWAFSYGYFLSFEKAWRRFNLEMVEWGLLPEFPVD